MTLRRCNARRCWVECQKLAGGIEQRRLTVDEWNARSRDRKRGIHMVPTKFGIAFGHK
jgi:xanthine dehydrogenase/oxidase